MGLSLRDAARETRKSKSTILRAIQSGRLSATRLGDGGYSIDPAELFRVYEPRTVAKNDAPVHDAPAIAPAATVTVQVDALREIIARMDAQIDDLKTDRDHWREQAEASSRLLTDERSRSHLSWWRRLVG